MSPGNKYQPYTAEDILRYLRNEMSVKEMRQLELDALDDPFLQDALDGYRLEWEKGEQEKLAVYANEAKAIPAAEKEEPARVFPFFRTGIFKYAVAAVLVAGAGWVLFTLNQPDSKKENMPEVVVHTNADTPLPAGDLAILENNEKPAPQGITSYNDQPSLEDSSSYSVASPATQEDIKAISGNAVPVGPPSLTGVATTDKDIAAAGKPVGPVTLSKKMTFTTDTGTVTGIERSYRDEDLAFSKTGEAKAVSRSAPSASFVSPPSQLSKQYRYQYNGKTVDKEKYPLENITLRVKGDTIGTVSDELGRFQLTLPDSQVTLVASGIGIETKEFLTKSKREKVELELEPSKSQMLQEAVISGYAARKSARPAQQIDMDTADASPKGGWTNFTRYVEKNKQVKAGKQPAYVVLSFEVDEKGRPASIEIIDSGGKTYDKEAMRLLKEGPSWINKTKDKITFAKITIVL